MDSWLENAIARENTQITASDRIAIMRLKKMVKLTTKNPNRHEAYAALQSAVEDFKDNWPDNWTNREAHLLFLQESTKAAALILTATTASAAAKSFDAALMFHSHFHSNVSVATEALLHRIMAESLLRLARMDVIRELASDGGAVPEGVQSRIEAAIQTVIQNHCAEKEGPKQENKDEKNERP